MLLFSGSLERGNIVQFRSIVATISLSVAALGGSILLFAGGLISFTVASGGLYGRGVLKDETASELLLGLGILLLSCLPLCFVILQAILWWRRGRLPRWLQQVSWIIVIAVLGIVCIDSIGTGLRSSGLSSEGLGVLTLPVLPFALGLLVFLISVRDSNES